MKIFFVWARGGDCYTAGMTHHVIYVPGLGSHRPHLQNLLIQYWRFFGMTPHYLPLDWANKNGYSQKQATLESLIQQLTAPDNSITLVGVSAGASICINSFAKLPNIERLICVSGKINHPETIGNHIFIENPDFKVSMSLVASSLASLSSIRRRGIASTLCLKDSTVPPADTFVEGALKCKVRGWNHASGIVIALFLRVPQLFRTLQL